MMNGMKSYLPEKMLFTGVFILSIQLVTGHAEKWDHFMLAQAWPPGTCADAPREHHTCHIVNKVKTWTIHGLWPSLGESKSPTSCNNSWPFDYNKIKGLQDQLEDYWPNLYNDTTPTSFWAHEWGKHGTCCSDLNTTAGEFNYFMAGLKLNKQFDISKMLKDSDVVPSETIQYGYEEFVGAVKKAIGFEPVLQCTTRQQKNGDTYHLIDQVQICLNKDFSPRSCTEGTVYPSGYYISKGNHSIYDFDKGEKNDLVGRRHSHHHYYEPQTSCPKKYKFNYPPIHVV